MNQDTRMSSAQAQARHGERIADLDKVQILAMARLILTLAEENDVPVLDTVATARKMQLLWEEVEKGAKSRGITELQRYGAEHVTAIGVEMIVMESGVKYDYSADQYWQELFDDASAADKKLKAHERVLRSLPLNGMGITIEETGQTYHAHRPARRATDTIKATVK